MKYKHLYRYTTSKLFQNNIMVIKSFHNFPKCCWILFISKFCNLFGNLSKKLKRVLSTIYYNTFTSNTIIRMHTHEISSVS